jgi:hypothetical protein
MGQRWPGPCGRPGAQRITEAPAKNNEIVTNIKMSVCWLTREIVARQIETIVDHVSLTAIVDRLYPIWGERFSLCVGFLQSQIRHFHKLMIYLNFVWRHVSCLHFVATTSNRG